MRAIISGIDYYLPHATLTNEELARLFPSWTPDRIAEKTGIKCRHIASPDEFASDLAAAAARKLFEHGVCEPRSIDYLVVCTQSPDYFLPTTACIVQHKLDIPTHAGALDINLGCSGYIYGLSLAKGLIETDQARHVLLVTADTYSKFISPTDQSVRTLFGDAAAATLISGTDDAAGCSPSIGPFVFGTDGRGAENLIVRGVGLRANTQGSGGQAPSGGHLFMNGPEIFNFATSAVPDCVRKVLHLAGKRADEIDLFVFHQANAFMLEHLRKKLGIPSERFSVCLSHCGNTVSSSIPIALYHAASDRSLLPGHVALLAGFGVGYSWGATLLRWGTG